MRTIAEVVAQGRDDAIAIAAVEGAPLTYRELRHQMARTIERLNGLGIGRGDPVGIVLPNGPAMATAFVSIAAGAVAAPLNPAYRAEEFDFYLADLEARALVVQAGVETPARAVAAERGIPVLELAMAEGGLAGAFSLEPAAAMATAPAQSGMGDADDVALVLHTSGTTSRPKIVPLRQRNLAASAANIRNTLALTPADAA